MEILNNYLIKMKAQTIWRISFYYECAILSLIQKWRNGKRF